MGGSNTDLPPTLERRAPFQGLNGGEDGFIGKWEIQAMEGGREIHQLPHPALLVISADTAISAGIDPYQLQLFTRKNEQDEWKPVRVEYRPKEQIFVARVSHFSQWGLGDGLSASGELIPSVKSFSANGFTGYAQVSYPIETPTGLGGISPNLQIGYSSGTADDMHNYNGDYSYEVQASWVGHGWNLSGLYYIVRDFGANKYMLVLNGISTEIVRTGNTNTDWRTDPEQFLQIEHWYPSSTVGYYRYDVDDWIVRTKDGMTYYFGSNQWDSDQEPIGNWTEVIFKNFYFSDGWKSVRTGSKWWLRAVEDPMGNRMEFTYDIETDWIGGECLRQVNNQPWWPTDKRYYDRTTYVREIRWSGNPGQGIPYRMRVLFHRQSRPDWKVYGWDKRCVQARFGKQRLQEIEVQVWDAIANGWHTQRRYRLYYIQNELHSLLNRIELVGKDGQSVLHTYHMTYSGGHNIVRLKTIDNGWGGSSEYAYGYEEIWDCHDCYGQGWASGSVPQVRPVSEIKHRDGVGNTTRIAYTYAGVRGHMINGSYEYLGHEWNRQDVYTNNSWVNISNRLEQRKETWYHQRLNNTTIDPRRGRAHHQRIFSSSGAKFQEAVTYWGYTSLNGRYWIHKDREDTYIYDWDGNDRSKVQKTWFFYNSNTGNLIRQEERASNGTTVLRKTLTDYANFSSYYILDRPSRIRVYNSSGNCAQEIRHSYDGYGRLIRSDQPTRWCGDTNSSYTITTRKSYDAFGNVTREWVDGTNRDIRTIYDSVLHVFPVRRYNNSHPQLDETVEYYGVNGGISAGDSRGYWGATKRFCGIDDICTYQSYDVFGRPSARWERSVGWSDVTKAQTRWFYFPYGYSGSQANVVVEWHHPRCRGNFSRKLYNGFGELIQEQGPDENWTTNMDGCNPGSAGGEVVVTHTYDGLGRKIRTSTPRSRPQWSWSTSAPWNEDWSNGYTQITYDPIGRTRTERSPNGMQKTYYYAYRDTSIVAEGINENDRLVSWSHQDELGRTTLLRSYRWENGSWVVDAEVQLGYDASDRLTKVERRNGSSGAWTLLTTLNYDLAGRKTSMWDADLGSWSYAYDKLGQLIRQTDARSKSTCTNYNPLGQITQKTVYDSSGCSGHVAAKYSYSYDSKGRLSSVNQQVGGSWLKSLSYDSLGRLRNQTVHIDNIAKTLETIYDAWQRPYATRYPDGEVVKVNYNSMGLPKLMCRAYWNNSAGAYYCTSQAWLVSDAHYDVAGRLTSMKYPAGGNLWRTQTYYGWTVGKNGGLLKEIKVGTWNGGSNRFYRKYTYNSFGDIATMKLASNGGAYGFIYDSLGRLTRAYQAGGAAEESFSYDPAGRMTSGGKSYNSGHPYHGVKSSGYGAHNYDANGNLTGANGMSYSWDAENRLASAIKNGVGESYAYDVDGVRIKRVQGNTITYTFFPVYEETWANGSQTERIKYYVFNGMRVAVKRGSSLYYLHGDHLGSTSETTNASGNHVASRTYYAYGTVRSSSGNLETDRTFTGQKADGTGLLYYNARYYDPALGTFLSPDTIVPDTGVVADYNRYMYARGNPMKYMDPSGHIAICFLGGYQNDAPIAQDSPLYQLCSEGLREGGYDPTRDGDILAFRNDEGDIVTALEAILAAQEANPYEPVILLGHSWGGAAAMKLAYYLNYVPDPGGTSATGGPSYRPVQVDLMILLDAENDLRTVGFPFGTLNSPDNLTDNVRMAVNIYAEDWDGPWGRDFPGDPQNGMNHIKGALNIGLSESRFANGSTAEANHWNLVHHKGSLNVVTKGLIADQVSLYLTGYDGQ